MATMRDIAELVGVAVSTVSAVLGEKKYCYVSEAKREKIRAAARELGYIPNQMSRGLRGLPTMTIGMIGGLFRVPVNTKLLLHLSEGLWDAGYQVLLGDSRAEKAREAKLVHEFLARGVDGLIVQTAHSQDELEAVIRGRTPHVACGMDYHEVAVDKSLGSYLAASHLIEHHGHRRIGFFVNSIRANRLKLEGYCKALAERGLDAPDEYCIEFGDDKREGLRRAHELSESSGVTAYLTSNDYLGAQLVNGLARRGRQIPEDIAVIGFDGMDVCECVSPALATIRQPMDEVAQAIVSLLFGRIQGKKRTTRPKLIRPELLVAESCGCARDDE